MVTSILSSVPYIFTYFFPGTVARGASELAVDFVEEGSKTVAGRAKEWVFPEREAIELSEIATAEAAAGLFALTIAGYAAGRVARSGNVAELVAQVKDELVSLQKGWDASPENQSERV
jgi:hypothetical protein